MPEDIVAKIEDIGIKGRAHGIVPRPEPAFSPEEKSEQLWGLFNEYSTFRRKFYKDTLRSKLGERKIGELTTDERDVARKELAENPLTQRLEGEISRLWENPSVRSVFQTKLKEALAEQEFHTPNLSTYRELQERYHRLQDEYFDLMRNQFLLRQMTPTLRGIEIARNRTERNLVEQNIDALEGNGGMLSDLITARGGLDREHADLAALIGFERIAAYHDQFVKGGGRGSGVIFAPSRQFLLEDTVEAVANGTTMLFTGETGTGKSTFAKRTSFILKGEPPQETSGKERGDISRLIGTKTLDGWDFGPLTIALTGCRNSKEMEEAIKTGKQPDGQIFLLDEINRYNSDALLGILNPIDSLAPGEEFNLDVLPGVRLRKAKRGFALITARNPNTERYQRLPLDPAIARRLKPGERKVDYLWMEPTIEDLADTFPDKGQAELEKLRENCKYELYEAFLSILMDDNKRIRVSIQELAPVWREVRDEAKGIIRQELEIDPKKHGALFRFAQATSEIHKSFNHKDSAAKTATDPGYLEETVLDMKTLSNWIFDYKSEIETGSSGVSLTTYLERKLHGFYRNIENTNDKSIFKRVFEQFGFNIENPQSLPKPSYQVLTPAEIGYLSPRVKRPVLRIGEEAIPHTRIFVLPDATELQYLPVSVGIEKDKSLLPDSLITHNGKTIRFLGKDPVSGKVRFVNTDENLVIDLSEGEVGKLFKSGQMRIFEPPKTEQGRVGETSNVMVERAREILGKDFLGVEAVRKLQEELKAVGKNVEFDIDKLPPIPYSEEDLRLAKENGEMLVARAESMSVGLRDVPLTLIEFRELFRKDPLSKKSTVFYSFGRDATDWYKSEDFATKQGEVKLGWALVKKGVLDDSLSKTWNEQEQLLKQYETYLRKKGAKSAQIRRRTVLEAAWDTMLYYVNNGDSLLESVYDWGQTRSSGGHLVCVGYFDSTGLSVGDGVPGGSYSGVGVCPSR